jgi:hypothetical protein
MTKLIPAALRGELLSLPHWQEHLRTAIATMPEAVLASFAAAITEGAMRSWHAAGLLDDPERWAVERAAGIRAGAWDATREQVSRSWLLEQLYRWVVDDLDVEEGARRSTAELERLIAVQRSGGQGDPPVGRSR